MPSNPPPGYHTLTSQAIVEDARATLAFVEDVFGGEVLDTFEEEGRIRHSEIKVGDSKLMVASTSEEFGAFPVMMNVYVEDVDATFERAIDHGATSLRPPEDQFYGDRTGGVLDSQGNQWWISTHIEDVSPEEMQRRIEETQG
ncbi:MAG TPA: VOC family protein [Acidimicrobiia bacterium]|nr:VOC family protein [Acidimicrobiia bacterium]